MRKDITIADQFEARKNWRGGLVDSVAATFLTRKRENPQSGDKFEGIEFLVTERLRGAEIGQFQAHHGGFMEVSDTDIWGGAAREVREEIGYELDPDKDLVSLGSIGPAIYRSEMSLQETGVALYISDVEAEPDVAFILPLFIADVTGKKCGTETDGEVTKGSWMTFREIVETFGSKGSRPCSKFNYFQYLVPALRHLSGDTTVASRRNIFAPGQYYIKL